MSYVGIRTHNQEVLARFRRRTEDWGANVQTVQHGQSHIGVALQNTTSLQVGFDNGVLCTVDGRIQSVENFGKSKGREAPRNDAVTVIKKWMRQGTSALRKMEMTASIALSDASSEHLVLARAQSGIPPIFFAETKETLLWSNSMSVLLRHGVKAEVDLLALDAYFAMGYVPAPWTLLKGIRKVPAGQFLEWDRGATTLRRHWSPLPQSKTAGNVQARAEQLKDRLCRSLDEIIDGYDRVGVLLSSGVDSSLLVGLLHCELGVSVEAFTFQYSDYNGRYNEYDRARRLTRQYDIPHHKIDYNADWLKSNLTNAVRQYEEPFSYGNHTARLKEVQQRGISLLLNGILPEGGFISRTATLALRMDGPIIEAMAQSSRGMIEALSPRKPSRLRHAIDVVASSAGRLFYNLSDNTILSDSERKSLYTNEQRVLTGREAMLRLFEKEVIDSGLDRKADQVAHLRNQFFVPDHLLWWNYRWASAHNLMMGAPYLTREVRSWMQSLRQPLWPPYEESIYKVLIRRAAATLMPEEIAYQDKIAQSAPFWKWFQGPLRPLLYEYVRPSKLREDGLFDVDFVQHVLREHVTGTGSRPYLLWTLFCFMVWKDEFLNGPHTS